ncbi:ParB/RepB/Spo0J family partition protein [Lewinella sp. JB7]|uniref:ParB/RepB/Spo0J family partition protein n=1 Tax=Lewinella sp. JB7 TaxID=2962887 RepID=UPI0020C9F3DC|nr:ParB/RepB/Spo0J family partition protein [Lewinella sp. JB7]MCP9237963.1 ParB/RepB/Spo0J family partition protein [Lewinella sp. JB7]
MPSVLQSSKLKDIPVDKVLPNPDNPRLIFRQDELDKLLVSILKFGVQVPISVYKEGSNYIIIDGERRWRTSKKLNLQTIPAIVQDKPDPLDNLLMMFNIHALRQQWDLFTIANKITDVVDLLTEKEGRPPNEKELSEETGLSRGLIRRCKLLIDLPERFKVVILQELERPKPKQKLTEDFFIEMERSLKTVSRNMPEVIDDIDRVRDTLIDKYQNNTIKNIVDFRKMAKLATAPKNVDYSEDKSKKALKQVFERNNKGIEQVYNSTVSGLYDEKKLLSILTNSLNHLKEIKTEDKQDADIRLVLHQLAEEIDNILNR